MKPMTVRIAIADRTAIFIPHIDLCGGFILSNHSRNLTIRIAASEIAKTRAGK